MGGDAMKGTERLHDLGQSLWLDNITRDLLNNNTLQGYIDELSITGLTSNPTIFDHALRSSSAYDDAISQKAGHIDSSEELFFELALEDLSRAAELFRPIHEKTNGIDGWVSLEVSPLLAYDTALTIDAARKLHKRASLSNLMIKIPGTNEGLPAIEEAIFSGVPVNVTLLFSRDQYLAAADAYLRGIERRVAAGLNPHIASVASVFISRWDVAVVNKVPVRLRNQLGIAIGKGIYAASSMFQSSQRCRRLYNAGARPQRLLWASTGTKGADASKTLYAKALAAPFTVNTMPEETLKAVAADTESFELLRSDGGNSEETRAEFAREGIDVDALANQLQDEGARSFMSSWYDLMEVITSKSGSFAKK
jgi:transaldolase